MKIDTTVKVLLFLIVLLLATIACQNLGPTSATKDSPQMTFEQGGVRLYVYYPDEKTAYLYYGWASASGPLECKKKATLSTPGGPVTVTKCQ